jgi:tetratricopeptide (TPR) repeat protein
MNNNVNALNNKGNSLYSFGNYTEDILYYDKALALDPKNVAALHNKGNAVDKAKTQKSILSKQDS